MTTTRQQEEHDYLSLTIANATPEHASRVIGKLEHNGMLYGYRIDQGLGSWAGEVEPCITVHFQGPRAVYQTILARLAQAYPGEDYAHLYNFTLGFTRYVNLHDIRANVRGGWRGYANMPTLVGGGDGPERKATR